VDGALEPVALASFLDVDLVTLADLTAASVVAFAVLGLRDAMVTRADRVVMCDGEEKSS
jgi:hypothetical protein